MRAFKFSETKLNSCARTDREASRRKKKRIAKCTTYSNVNVSRNTSAPKLRDHFYPFHTLRGIIFPSRYHQIDCVFGRRHRGVSRGYRVRFGTCSRYKRRASIFVESRVHIDHTLPFDQVCAILHVGKRVEKAHTRAILVSSCS